MDSPLRNPAARRTQEPMTGLGRRIGLEWDANCQAGRLTKEANDEAY